MLAIFRKEKTLIRVKDDIDCFQNLIDCGCENEEVCRRLRLAKIEYEYLQTLEDDNYFAGKRCEFLSEIGFL